MSNQRDHDSPRSLLWSLVGLALCVFLWPALLTFDGADWPTPNRFPHPTPSLNACGPVGAWLAYQFRYYLGDGSYPLLLFSTLAALMRVLRGGIGHVPERACGLVLVVLCTSASAHLISVREVCALPVGHGGLLGFAGGEWLRENLSRVGTVIVLVSSLVVGLIFTTEGWVLTLPSFAIRVGKASGQVLGMIRTRVSALSTASPVATRQAVTVEEARALLTAEGSKSRIKPATRRRNRDEYQELLLDDEADRDDADVEESGEQPQRPGRRSHAANLAKAKRAARAAADPVVNFPTPQKLARAEPYPRQIENWRLPELSLLREPEYGFTGQQEVLVREQARTLEQTLEEFRLDARVVEIDTGPVITMFELKIGAGIKVSQVASLSNDIARALKAHAVRVVAPISGKNTVGIEVPNQKKEKVRLKELIALAGRRASEMGLPLFLGKDAGGAALVADLTQMPHLLIAGTTGSGKSVCLNSIIVSFLMTQRPDHVKLIMIDPKMVEMSQFKKVPHLMCPIVTDMARAEQILEWAVTKMEARYEILAEAHVKNIASYNELGADEIYTRLNPRSAEEKSRISTRLPYIVIIIDELADLMMSAAKEVEHHLSRLAQKSRAVGIHIIVATQRPEAKIVTGLIKSNLPSRICFRVSSRMDSRIVLDRNGGEVLMGQGDMLFLPPGANKLIRSQGTYLEEEEIRAVLDDLTSRAKPDYHPELIRLRSAGAEHVDGTRDPLFDEAVRIILESKRGSVSLLQRRLTVGYSRASRLIDQMADAGIVGDYKGSQAREVLMTLLEWEAVKRQVQVDLEQGFEADDPDATLKASGSNSNAHTDN